MKKILLILALLAGFLQSQAQEKNIRAPRVSQDTSKFSSIDKIPSCPATGIKLFYYRDTLRGIDSLCHVHNITKVGTGDVAWTLYGAANWTASAHTYHVGDVVKYGTYPADVKWYICKKQHVSEALAAPDPAPSPADTYLDMSYWKLIHWQRAESDPKYAADSIKLLHWADTLNMIATKHDLDTMGFIYSSDLRGIRDTLLFHSDSLTAIYDSVARMRDTTTNHSTRLVGLERLTSYDVQNAHAWVVSTAYKIGDVVTYTTPTFHSRLFFVCTVAHTSAGTSPYNIDGAKWKEIFWQESFAYNATGIRDTLTASRNRISAIENDTTHYQYAWEWFNGTRARTIPKATTDLDRFLADSAGFMKYRTGTELLSDIGAQAALTNPLTGTGVAGFLAEFNGTTGLDSAFIYHSGNEFRINTTSDAGAFQLQVSGGGYFGGNSDFRGTYNFFGANGGDTYIKNDEINFFYSTNANAVGWINYDGYNGTNSQFRDLWIGDGKHGGILFVDGSEGNTGLLTSDPTSTLSIGGIASQGITMQGLSTTATRGFLGLDADGDGSFYLVNASTFSVNIGLTADLTDHSYIMNFLGAGTRDPQYPLDVVSGETTLLSFMAAMKNTSGEGVFFFHTGSAGSGFGLPANSIGIAADYNTGSYRSLSLATSNLARLFIDTDGDISVGGTTTTTSKFEIKNSVTGKEGLRVIQTTAGRTSGGALALFYDDQAATTEPTVKIIQNGTGNLLLAQQASTPVLTIDYLGRSNFGNSTVSERVTIEPITAGLGLGLINNSAHLSGINFLMYSSPTTSYTRITADARSTGFIKFLTNDTEQLKIASTGLITITTFGTSAGNFITEASGVLQKRSAAEVRTDLALSTNYLMLDASNDPLTGTLSINTTGSTIIHGTTVSTNPVYEYFNNGSGNAYVGIESSTGGALMTGGSAYALALTSGQGGSYPIQFATGASGTVRMTLSGAGNLGLGVIPDAAAKLHVLDNFTTNGSAAIYVEKSGTIAGGTGYGIDIQMSGASAANVAGYFRSINGSNNYGLFVPNGAVAIGLTTVTAPVSLFHVSGGDSNEMTIEETSVTGAASLRMTNSGGTAGTTRIYKFGSGHTYPGMFGISMDDGTTQHFLMNTTGQIGLSTSTFITNASLNLIGGGRYIAWNFGVGQANSRAWGIRNDGADWGDLEFVSSDAADNTLHRVNLTLDKDGNLWSHSSFAWFGATKGFTYINNDEINFGYSENANFTGWINYDGYANSTTQYRDLSIGDGKRAAIAYFDGSTANVGIGMTPDGTARLNVNGGDIKITNSVRANLNILGGWSSIDFWSTDATASQRNWTIAQSNIAFADFGFYQSTALGGDPIAAGVARFYINAAGNIGQGTTAPAPAEASNRTFQIHNTATYSSELRLTNNASGATSTDGGLLQFTNSKTFWIWNYEVGEVAFGTSNTDRGRITAAGDFVLGGTAKVNPYTEGHTTLSVRGNGVDKLANIELVGTRNSGGNQQGQILFVDNYGTATTASMIASLNDTYSDDGDMAFYTHAHGGTLTQYLTLTHNGNLGLGKTNPTAARFEINTSSASGEGMRILQTTTGRTDGSALLLLYDDQVGSNSPTLQIIQSGTGRALQVQDGGVTVFNIADGGYVNLGAPSQYARLGIKMNTTDNFRGIWLEAKDNTDAVAVAHTGSMGYITTEYSTGGSKTPLMIRSYDGAYLYLNTDGKSGFNVSDPDATLEVAGDIHAQTIRLETGAVAGYTWQCQDATGTGAWANVTGAVYKGTVDGDDGKPSGGTALKDGTGTAGWYYACNDAGTYDYGNPNGNSITLAIGDQLYYNGSIWLQIPGAGSYNLPIATASLGGIITGTDISINSGTGAVTIANGVITLAKMANMNTAKVLGRTTSSVGVVEELGISGTGSVAMTTSPTFVTPTLGAASATTYNGLTITANGTNTLNITAGKTLVVQDNVTITGPLGTGAYATISNYATTAGKLSQFGSTSSAELAGVLSDESGTGVVAYTTDPTFTNPRLGTPYSGTLTNCTGLPITGITASTSAQLATLISDETGASSGSPLLMFNVSPTIQGTPIINAINTNGADFVLGNGATSSEFFAARYNGGVGYVELKYDGTTILATNQYGVNLTTSYYYAIAGNNILATTVIDGSTTTAPNGNAVYDALALKVDKASVTKQALEPAGTGAVTWNVANGQNAYIVSSGGTAVSASFTLTLTNLVAGTSGNLSIMNPAANYRIHVHNGTNHAGEDFYMRVAPNIRSAAASFDMTGSGGFDVFSWYYDGEYLWWNGTKGYN